ncbi:MAG: extracellular solute-binding protein [Eubacteriales bacterium]|nr:extracellular solute-binding protein [Eubacteriales bacterium]
MAYRCQKVLVVVITLLLVAEIIHASRMNQADTVTLQEERPLLVWYTDPDIQQYMEETAEKAGEAYGVQVRTELVSEVDYIENISEESVSEEMTGPDLYVVSSSLLEKAALAGLTDPVDQSELSGDYSEKAIHAAVYQGRTMARPFYVETCFLLYNRYYTEQAPATVDEILAYADSFEPDDVTAGVDKIFEWNVADVIENYMFLGAYTDLGGEDGDDMGQVSMDLERIGECMAYYQSLNGYFAIDADTVTSEQIVQDFIDGKTVYMIANAAMLARVDEAAENGELPEYPSERTVVNEEGAEETQTLEFEPFYGAAALPDLTAELETRGLSVTNSVAVNPYSRNPEAAHAVAEYLTAGNAAGLYREADKLPAFRALEEAPTPAWEAVCQAYDEAAEIPKLMELSDIWLHLEAALADIWRGEDASEQMAEFAGLLDGRME